MLTIIKKKKSKRTLTRQVYLMELNPNFIKNLFSFFGLCDRQIKIGIAKNTKQRHEDVDAGIKGKVVVLNTYLIDSASRVEADLHKQYKKHRFTARGAKGSGKTEFFNLTTKQINDIRRTLRKKERTSIPFVKVLFTILFLLSIFYYLIKQ